MKRLLNILPELYFMGLGIFWIGENFLFSGKINYLALLLTWLMFLQVFYKNRLAGIVYSVVLALFSAYMAYDKALAWLGSESFTLESFEALFSAGIFAAGLIMAISMLSKYIRAKDKYDESVLTVTY